MKTIQEIQAMLVVELYNSLNNIRTTKPELNYYNKILGDTSYLLSTLLEVLLKNKFSDWDSKKWIDDSLITKIKLNGNKLSIWGIIIWGIVNKTEQWTEPFYFEIELNLHAMDFIKYVFLFGDLNIPEINYENFSQKRTFWDKKYYTNDNWDPSQRNWKYIINCTSGSNPQ